MHRFFRSVPPNRAVWLYMLLLAGMAGLYCGIALPAQEKARITLGKAQTLLQRDSIYADSVALVRAVEAFDTPLGKLSGHNTLARAYFHLGNYYWFYTSQYERAAWCYTQADYYMTDIPALRSRINRQMAEMCRQCGAASPATVYAERAMELGGGNTIRQPLTPAFEADGVEQAMAVRVLEEYLSKGEVFVPWQFGTGLFATVIVLLSVFFISFYQTSSARLQTQKQQMEAMAHSADTARETELRHNIAELREHYPVPDKAWSDFSVLKQACNKPLLFVTERLEQQSLSEKEITFCVLCLLYPDMPLPQVADHICYARSAIRSYKLRVAKKLHTSSAGLYDTLIRIAVSIPEKGCFLEEHIISH